MNDEVNNQAAIYVVKTTVSQERTVANFIEKVAKKGHLDIYAILAPDELKGYVLVEASRPYKQMIDINIKVRDRW